MLRVVRYCYFRFVSAVLKCVNMVANSFQYIICGQLLSKLSHLPTLSTCIVAFHVCSGKYVLRLIKVHIIEPFSDKPEVDIMMPTLVPEAQVIQWQWHRNNCHIPLTIRWDYAKSTVGWVNCSSQLHAQGLKANHLGLQVKNKVHWNWDKHVIFSYQANYHIMLLLAAKNYQNPSIQFGQ